MGQEYRRLISNMMLGFDFMVYAFSLVKANFVLKSDHDFCLFHLKTPLQHNR